MEFRHEPVLLREVIEWMNVRADGVYCDGTLGGGGHSEAVLTASGGTAALYFIGDVVNKAENSQNLRDISSMFGFAAQ